jgi:hypothetical protein
MILVWDSAQRLSLRHVQVEVYGGGVSTPVEVPS